jgi:predicted amidohydrolase YtcJ
VTFTGPGFVDYHAHLLREASGVAPWGDLSAVRSYHLHCADRGIGPMDELDPPAAAGLADRLLASLTWAASTGLVEIWEAGIRDWALADALTSLRSSGPLPVRVRLLAAAGLAETSMRARLGDPWLDFAGVKFYADGWLGPRTCAVSQPFRDEPGNSGLLFETSDHLARRIEPFANAGWTIATHAIGDLAIESVLGAYEQVFGTDCKTAAPRIEHAQLLREDLTSRMAEDGVVACIQPGFAADDAPHVAQALGGDWPAAYRWSSLLAAGVRVICGSDYPIDSLEPLKGLQKLLRNPFDQLGPDAAVKLMTNGDLGTVTLSQDPRDATVDDIDKIEVIATGVRGS